MYITHSQHLQSAPNGPVNGDIFHDPRDLYTATQAVLRIPPPLLLSLPVGWQIWGYIIFVTSSNAVFLPDGLWVLFLHQNLKFTSRPEPNQYAKPLRTMMMVDSMAVRKL